MTARPPSNPQGGPHRGRTADLPVVQSSRFDLVINAQTARILGLTVPRSLLATDDAIEY